MSRKHKFGDNDAVYFISYAVVYWIDLFIRNEYKEILVESWRYCQREKGLEIFGWCIMTSHIHMIIGSDKRDLSKIVGEMKGYTSIQLRKAIEDHPRESRKEWMQRMMQSAGMKNSNNKEWQLWQQHNKPIEIYSQKVFDQELNYIHQNPVVAVFVEQPEGWLYSNPRDFYGKKGLIELCNY